MKGIYLDHAAATPMDPAVEKAMAPYARAYPGNPGSFHTPGLRAKDAVDGARKTVAGILACRPESIIFTSGGTESANLAVQGIPRAMKGVEKPHDGTVHVVTSAIEHPAVLEPLMDMEKRGEISLTVVPVGRDGIVDASDVMDAVRDHTVLVSIMYANNEIGTIQPIAEIGRAILKRRKESKTPLPYFHTDACQAAGALDLDVEKMHVDAMTLNGSKIYGPKGAGLLYLRRGVPVRPLVHGGGQERNVRSGTENVPGIVGMATALEIAHRRREKDVVRLTKLRDRVITGLLAIPKSRLNGHAEQRLPNNVNISFLDIEGEAAVLYLDAEGIYVSTGSACASASLDPSHVILALGVSYEAAHGSLRLTLGRATTAKDVDNVVTVMPGIVERLRKLSPVDLNMKHFAASL